MTEEAGWFEGVVESQQLGLESPAIATAPSRDLDGLLRQLLGPDAGFRSGQREAVEAVLSDGARVLVVQKTGWGKSVVYWLATRVRRDEGHGPALIISPLLSLMRDQIRAAERLGIRAVSINSQNRDDWASIITALERDEIDVLLISPERLANEDFVQRTLPAIQGSIGLFVVDEVHCISDWGHDFRPDYRRIGSMLKALPLSVPVLGTTATANARVRDDVASQLGSATRSIVGSLARDSLRLATLTVHDQAERLAWLARYVPQIPGSGIVYCLTVADTERVAAWLTLRGLDARPYHGRMDADERERLEQALLGNELKVLVATVALGMGFDKPDLRFVIHYQRPGSVIFYYQQVGRAGRAVRDADGILLSGREDDDIQEYFIDSAFPPIEEMRSVIDALSDSGPTGINYLSTRVNLSRGRIQAILKTLEVDGWVSRDGGKYFLPPVEWVPDDERVARVTETRRRELEQMREYLSCDGCLMRFLTTALDDPTSEACGRCMNCRRSMPLSAVDPEIVRAAVSFLKRAERPIGPRKKWAIGAVPDLNGFIEHPNEPGVALCVYRDAGWGQQVYRAKYEQKAIGPELLDAAAELIARQWQPASDASWWVTSIPSRRQSRLVADAARGLSERLGLEYREDVLSMSLTGSQQKLMQNSVMQLRNAHEGLSVIEEQVRSGPVLLVDDLVDSRWTYTVAGHLLRTCGAGPVHPFAFAEASTRLDA